MRAATNTLRDDEKVDRGFNEVAHADGRNHAIEDEAHAADGGSRHQSDEAGEFGAETEQDGEAGRQADHGGIKHLREVEHARVLAVRRVGRSPEEKLRMWLIHRR